MRVTVKLFAVLRERAGLAELPLDLPDGHNVAGASKQLAQRLPAIRDLLPRVAFAVNCEYVPTSTVLNDGDELAIIPPVSGGCA